MRPTTSCFDDTDAIARAIVDGILDNDPGRGSGVFILLQIFQNGAYQTSFPLAEQMNTLVVQGLPALSSVEVYSRYVPRFRSWITTPQMEQERDGMDTIHFF